MTSKHYDIVVVGAGVFGAAVAYQFSKTGRSVVVIDDRPIGQNASGKNAGNLNPIYKSPERLIPLALRAFDLHQHLMPELLDLGIHNHKIKEVRRILLASSDDELAGLKDIQKTFEKFENFAAHFIDDRALREADPRLSNNFAMGLLLEGNQCVDSLEFNKALMNGAKMHGAAFIQAKVNQVKKDKYKVVGLETTNDSFTCGDIIFATGPWVSEINAWLNLNLPIEPLKGQILRIRAPKKGLTYDFTHGLHTLYKRGENEIWLGVTNENVGFDEVSTKEAKDHLLNQSIAMMPSLQDAEILEHSASLRAITPSELPIASQAPAWDNAYIVNGGGWKGVLLSLGVAEIVYNLINHKKPSFQLNTHSLI